MKESNMAVLYIVLPCYNEHEVLNETNKRLVKKLRSMINSGICDHKSRILYVDDGSTDNTWDLIVKFHNSDEIVSGLKLAHNKGHQNALLAGLMAAKDLCDCAASMDADLQDDINVLDDFMKKYSDGCEVVYAVRNKRDTDTVFKRGTAQGFYKFMQKLGVEIIYNHADCRLLSKRVLNSLSEYKESNLFLRGIVPDIGFKSDVVYFDRMERYSGESKYSFKKMLSLAINGITSFSVKPLRLITSLGVIFTLMSVLALIAELIVHLCSIAVPSWLIVIAAVWLLGGIQLFCLGIAGEYIGKIYTEVKARPRYIVEKFINK